MSECVSDTHPPAHRQVNRPLSDKAQPPTQRHSGSVQPAAVWAGVEERVVGVDATRVHIRRCMHEHVLHPTITCVLTYVCLPTMLLCVDLFMYVQICDSISKYGVEARVHVTRT